MNELEKMTMTLELITPEYAAVLLETNTENRTISRGTVTAYANDMISGNWDETVGVGISIDADGILRDGQHRLMAIVESGASIHMWVCRNVSKDGIYDNNRKRSNADQISISKPEFENVYKSTRYISVARTLITHGDRRSVTPKEIINFTEKHKIDLDEFFLNLPQSTVPKISLAVVHLSLFMAYMNGVSIETITDYYDVLCSGMGNGPEDYPIIAYRNYLMNTSNAIPTSMEICRCQYSLQKYITKSCTKRNIAPKELIYPFPW